jgi:hypothetical protein
MQHVSISAPIALASQGGPGPTGALEALDAVLISLIGTVLPASLPPGAAVLALLCLKVLALFGAAFLVLTRISGRPSSPWANRSFGRRPRRWSR